MIGRINKTMRVYWPSHEQVTLFMANGFTTIHIWSIYATKNSVSYKEPCNITPVLYNVLMNIINNAYSCFDDSEYNKFS